MKLLRLESILVAADLNESSIPVLQAAARLASLAGASLHLLHVAAADEPDGEDRLLDHFREAAPGGVQPDSVHVAFGYPPAIIVARAERLSADVIVVGPHRRRTIAGPLGSTAASVVRTATCPCLVASVELRLPLERVLIAVDVSDTESRALSVALTWASALRPRGAPADLLALHVTPGSDTGNALKDLRSQIDLTEASAHSASRVSIDHHIMPGPDPAEVILQHAGSYGADLLVMGTRSTTGRQSELGSVSAAVARDTPCPLLLVPPATPLPTAS